MDPESSEEGQEKTARAEELKNTANQFFKGRHSWVHITLLNRPWLVVHVCVFVCLFVSEGMSN